MSKTSEKTDCALEISRLVKMSADKLYRGWTEPALLEQWFCPRPWRATEAVMELRPGGAFNTVMCGPEGERFANEGCFLEIVPNQKLVFTDAFKANFRPGNPFMVATITFQEKDGQTLYAARAEHWSVEDREKHEQMGFYEGWNKALDQLLELAESL